jgi:hypothetical protein
MVDVQLAVLSPVEVGPAAAQVAGTITKFPNCPGQSTGGTQTAAAAAAGISGPSSLDGMRRPMTKDEAYDIAARLFLRAWER